MDRNSGHAFYFGQCTLLRFLARQQRMISLQEHTQQPYVVMGHIAGQAVDRALARGIMGFADGARKFLRGGRVFDEPCEPGKNLSRAEWRLLFRSKTLSQQHTQDLGKIGKDSLASVLIT